MVRKSAAMSLDQIGNILCGEDSRKNRETATCVRPAGLRLALLRSSRRESVQQDEKRLRSCPSDKPRAAPRKFQITAFMAAFEGIQHGEGDDDDDGLAFPMVCPSTTLDDQGDGRNAERLRQSRG